MRRLRFVVLIALAHLAMGTVMHARTLALVAGVGDYGGDPRNNLPCLDADLRNIRRVLSGPMAVQEADILVLSNRQATASAIVSAFRTHLVKQAGPADTVVFYFSGHGYHVPDLNGDEGDGEDEILVPHGFDLVDEKTYLTDDQLAVLLKELRCQRVVVILDCCHSGTGTRGIYDNIVKSWKAPFEDAPTKTGFEYRPRPGTNSFQRLPTLSVASAGTAETRETLVLTACKADETALGPRNGSVFTAILAEKLAAGPQQDMSQLAPAVARDVSALAAKVANGHKQTPQFEGPATALLAGRSAPPPTAVPPANPTLVNSPGIAPTIRVEPSRPVAPRPVPAAAATGPNQLPGELIQHRDFAATLQLTHPQTGENLAAREIKVGTDVRIQLKVGRDCYVRLYHMDAASKLTLIYPNRFQTNNFVRADTTALFPGPNDAFRLEIEEPLGPELIKAVCSSVPFNDELLPPVGDSPFFRLNALRSGELSTRGLGAYAVTPNSPPREQSETYVKYLVVK